ncbi:helix-turn-helix transcriptional regulator [Kitasatospora sp. NPDC002551]|uniref:helix-turn-helix domain-containing protein n=1 Tax=unclassified Kitasatospora TaxID=2633591 RepID=UPI00331B70FE
MNWNSVVVREASRTGNYGKVVELARIHRRLTQLQLGAACGLSQSAVSRLEKRGSGPYAMDVLLRISRHLEIPPAVLGLAGPPTRTTKGGENVERRQFLGAAAAIAVAAPVLAVVDHVMDETEPQTGSGSPRPRTGGWTVFTFDESKIAAVRVNCGAKLGLATWTSEGVRSPAATGHAKQRALLFMDVAAGHLAAGRVEAAFALGGQALEIGLQYRSGRIVERGRSLRRSFSTSSPSKAVREFDERLHGVHL